MNVKHASTYISVLDYLDGEKISDVKHEYINGEVYAMAGASRSHNILTGNVWSAFMAHLDGTRCISFSSDMKVNIDNQFFYPDVLVTCDDDLGDDYYTKAPIILVEVLSKSTRKMDKSFKLAAYKTIPSLLEYVLIEQEFAEMVKAVREAERAIGVVNYSLTEKQAKGKDFSRSLYVVKDIKAGEELFINYNAEVDQESPVWFEQH